jgi:hypothetical protein
MHTTKCSDLFLAIVFVLKQTLDLQFPTADAGGFVPTPLREVDQAVGWTNASEAPAFPFRARSYVLRKTSDLSDTRPGGECLYLRNLARIENCIGR